MTIEASDNHNISGPGGDITTKQVEAFTAYFTYQQMSSNIRNVCH